jgi:hypothetical protein
MRKLVNVLGLVALSFATAAVFGWALGSSMDGQQVEAGGGAINNVIAVTGNERNRLYLIDTQNKTILVYEEPGRVGFNFVAGRWYDMDSEICVQNEVPYDQRGYPLQRVLQIRNAREGAGTRR